MSSSTSNEPFAPSRTLLAVPLSLVTAWACGNRPNIPPTPPPATAAATVTAPAPRSSEHPAARLAAPAMPGKNVPAIKVNTVGYPARWRKLAVFNVEPKAVRILDEKGTVVYEVPAARIAHRGIDAASRDPIWHVDFSEFQKQGRFVISADGAQSDAFVIEARPYRTALVAAQKALYFQRTRTALEKPYAVWEGDEFLRAGVSHAHGDVGWLFEDYPDKKRRIQVDAGWHDAGNFDMYVPSTAPSRTGCSGRTNATPPSSLTATRTFQSPGTVFRTFSTKPNGAFAGC